MDKKIIVLILAVILIGGGFMAFTFFNNKSDKEIVTTGENQEKIEEQSEEGNTEEGSTEKRILVLYFSQSGNTETVAKLIHDKVGGDLVKIETEQTYPSDYNELLDYDQNEQRTSARPRLKTDINVNQYDVIFLGYPNWWGDMPMPIYSFLDNYDLSGKTIAPFITHGGSGLSGTPGKIKQNESQATVTEGLAVNGSNASNSQSDVNNWLTEIGF